MIGYFDYTVWLTYASLISATLGIFVSLSGTGHPYWGTMFLMFSGLCDAFDGKVARTKPNRTRAEMDYGVQIDSLSDLVAFGVLPACICIAMRRSMLFLQQQAGMAPGLTARLPHALLCAVAAVYVLAALIRLAYFNITQSDADVPNGSRRDYFTGLPVTSAALIFPAFMILQYLTLTDITAGCYALLLLTAVAFVSRFKVRKPNLKTVLILVGIGALEFVILLVLKLVLRHG